MMKRLTILPILTLAACTSTGQVDPEYGQRLAADLQCVAQLAIDGVEVAGNPAFGGVKTAADVVKAVEAAKSVSSNALSACGQMLKNVGYDINALKAKIEANKVKK